MKIIPLVPCVVLVSCVWVCDVSAQITARHLTQKAINANASENRALNKALNQPSAPSPQLTVPPAVAPAAVPPRAPTNGVPEKTAEQKAAILQKTIEFQKKRAEAGAPSAQYDLGLRYLNGDGVEKNLELAQKWLNSAATNGNTQAVKKLKELDKK